MVHAVDAQSATLFNAEATCFSFETIQNGSIVHYNENITSNTLNYNVDIVVSDVNNRDPDHFASNGQYRFSSNQW